jgi:hypothetical protein
MNCLFDECEKKRYFIDTILNECPKQIENGKRKWLFDTTVVLHVNNRQGHGHLDKLM